MSRTKDLPGIVGACMLAIGSLLAGCTRSDSISAADRPAPVAESSVGSEELPEVIVTAPRPDSKRIVLSERNARSRRD